MDRRYILSRQNKELKNRNFKKQRTAVDCKTQKHKQSKGTTKSVQRKRAKERKDKL